MNCEQALAYIRSSLDNWYTWCEASQTKDPEAWDRAFESYVDQQEKLNVSEGHPPGKPRSRP